MSTLNAAQAEAVEHFEGPLQIMAGPGSGKTKTVTHRVARLLERGVEPSRILLVTFTKKASAEMQVRIGQLVGKQNANAVWAGTFHGICNRFLRAFKHDRDREGRKRDFTIYDQKDAVAVAKAAVSELGLDKKQWPERDMQSRISRLKGQGVTAEEAPEHDEQAVIGKNIWLRYEAILLHNNAFDFDDLMCVVMRQAESGLENGRFLCSRFDHVLVDEYQDTNAVQFRLVKALGSGTNNVCVVGDLRQSIYSFRGADHTNLLLFKERYPTAKLVDLTLNYRSTKTIVAAFNCLQPGSVMETPNATGDLIRVRGCRDGEHEADVVAGQILEKIREDVPRSELAVLYRVHALSRAIEERLRDAGVKYQIVGGTKFYERKVVKDVLAYIRLLSNPQSDLDFERVINVPPRALGPKAVDRVRQEARRTGKSMCETVPTVLDAFKGNARSGLQRFHLLLVQAHRDRHAGTLADAVATMLVSSGYRKHLDAKQKTAATKRKAVDAEKYAQQLLHLDQVVAAVTAYEKRHKEPSFEGFLEEVSLLTDQDSLKGDAVSLMTIHGSKGLEYNAVWVIGFERGLLPFGRSGKSNGAPDAPMDVDMAEEARLAFVACSRPRKWLSLTYAAERMMYGKTEQKGPSRFLRMINPELIVRA